MSFNFLPWQLYVIMMIGGSMLFFGYVKQSSKENPKLLTVGLGLICIAGVMVGLHKLMDKTGIFKQYIDMMKILTGFSGLLALPFVFGGVYNKVKHDPEKRKLVLMQIAGLVVTLLIMALIVLSSM